LGGFVVVCRVPTHNKTGGAKRLPMRSLYRSKPSVRGKPATARPS
jgi:hypothetical protein